MPTREQLDERPRIVEAAQARLTRHAGSSTMSCPTITRSCPSPAWAAGASSHQVSPSGKVLPCHAARDLAGLAFDNVARPPARRHLARLARLQPLPRHGLDDGALPVLRPRARSTSAAAAARPSRSPATPRRPIRPVTCRRTTRDLSPSPNSESEQIAPPLIYRRMAGAGEPAEAV